MRARMELFHTINETLSFLELLHSLAPTGESLHRSTSRRRTGSSHQSSLEYSTVSTRSLWETVFARSRGLLLAEGER